MLINSNSIVQCSCVNNSVNRRTCWPSSGALEHVRKSMKEWIFCASVKAWALIETEKIAYEYLKNRNFSMSKTGPVLRKSEAVSFKLVNQLLFFSTSSCVNNSVNRGICQPISGAWVWRREYFVLLSNLELALLEMGKIAFKYWNKRNLSVRQTDVVLHISRKSAFRREVASWALARARETSAVFLGYLLAFFCSVNIHQLLENFTGVKKTWFMSVFGTFRRWNS